MDAGDQGSDRTNGSSDFGSEDKLQIIDFSRMSDELASQVRAMLEESSSPDTVKDQVLRLGFYLT